jgi:hypothetical protein
VEVVEMIVNADRLEHSARVGRIAIGEDEAPSREPRQNSYEPLVTGHPVEGDVVDVFEEMMGIDFMLLHQARKRRPVGMEMVFLEPACLFGPDIEQSPDVRRHSLVDQREKIGRGRIQAIVEIEDPIAYMGKARVHRRPGE